MKPEKSLFNLYSFWMAIFLPITIALILGFSIYDKDYMDFTFSYHGINQFITIFKVPISISALAFPLVALVATNHRSVQSAKQIQLTMEQNTFSNYFKHKEEFRNLLRELEEDLNIEFNNIQELYRKLFPKSNNLNQNFDVDIQYLINLNKKFSALKDLVKNYKGNTKKDMQSFFINLSEKTSSDYYFNSKNECDFFTDDKNKINLDYSQLEPLKQYDLIYNVLENISYFCNIKLNIKKLKLTNKLFIDEHYNHCIIF